MRDEHPSSVSSVVYTSARGTPSAIRANSRLATGERFIPLLPGNCSRSKKSAIVVGFQVANPRVVVRDHPRKEQLGYAAFGDRTLDEIIRRGRAVGALWQVVDANRYEQPFVATPDEFGHIQINDIPEHVAHLHLGTDLRQSSGVVLQVDAYACFRLELFVVGYIAGPSVRTAEADKR